MSREFELLRALRPLLDGDGPGLPVGVGDDGAVLQIGNEAVVIVVDAMVDGVHVDRTLSSPQDFGFKALAVNVSDIAAMGGHAVAAVVALQRSPDVDDAYHMACYEGLRAAADAFGVRLVGGDTVDAPTLSITVTVVGRLLRADRPLRRDGAKVGDLAAVIGPLGLAAAALAAHRAGRHDLLTTEPDLLASHRRPTPQTAGATSLVTAGVGCAIDVSDGLGRDLAHIAGASDVGIRLDERRLPRHAGVTAVADALGLDPVDLVVGGGDDYSLACTIPVASFPGADRACEAAGLRLRIVGEVVDDHVGRVHLVRDDGVTRDVSELGWEHAGHDAEGTT